MPDFVSSIQLDEIVRRIVEAVHPEKIILFGSLARGDAGPDSDLDLLVVMATSERRHRRAIPISRLFRPRPCPMDILVYTTKAAAPGVVWNGGALVYPGTVDTDRIVKS